jgi:hypothetical protein
LIAPVHGSVASQHASCCYSDFVIILVIVFLTRSKHGSNHYAAKDGCQRHHHFFRHFHLLIGVLGKSRQSYYIFIKQPKEKEKDFENIRLKSSVTVTRKSLFDNTFSVTLVFR